MCGSGTLAIEAAWLALRRPPGLTRKRFGLMGWMDYDVRLWTQLRDEARRGVLPRLPAPILGADVRADAVNFARTNARAAGIGHLLTFERRDLADFEPPPGAPGILICNPPYGERLGDEKELRPLYRLLGDVFRRRCQGWKLFVFAGNATLARQIRQRPSVQVPLFNGKIPCHLLRYDSGEPTGTTSGE
jgi:putative N6-adenine-specific DNA methylase